MIKGIHITCNRKPGKPVRWYVYAWRGGPLVMKQEGGRRPTIGPKEIEKYHEAVKARNAAPPETMAALVADYRQSEEWKRLAEHTRRTWALRLDLIDQKWGKTPISVWSDPRMVRKVIEWRNSFSATPRAADNNVTVLRQLLEWGRLNARVVVNVANGIPQLYKGGERAEIIWTDDDLTAFAASAPQHINDAVRLACLTGLRVADLAALEWSEVGEKAIMRVALKVSKRKRRRVSVPIIPELRTLLDELRTRHRAKDVETVLVNSFGRAWSSDGLTGSVVRERDNAGIVHIDGRKKHLHDCRGSFATRLILAGLTDKEIAFILGWSVDRVSNIRRVYVDDASVIVALADRIAAVGCQPNVNRPKLREVI